ncbi:single-stranded DNA-binding protein [Pedobacter yonginense]|uniref:Single-stranded DNA-binding protein n=1 Tax=Pedobacter yonginense TaxID=651869 RepID=A0A317EIN2_9SPHI|nr:single-stranded DNA-binding protein [Pedobacter yonginense]PWS26492.1 single-stranded DNA-binding protein [Pedobacter yonginense]
MKSAMNKVVLSGFAGADAEVKTVAGNQKLVKVSLAVHDYYKTASGEEIDRTQWISLTFWNAKADLAEAQIKKGTQLTVEGKLLTGSYEAKDGTKRFSAEVVVNELEIKERETVN